jgi:hypothetical protein
MGGSLQDPERTKNFAVFDMLKGYHQIELDDESRHLTTFLTPFGMFWYLRLPFRHNLSVIASPKGMETTLSIWLRVPKELLKTHLILGNTSTQLEEQAEAFVKACCESNITLNLCKVQRGCPEVLFWRFYH